MNRITARIKWKGFLLAGVILCFSKGPAEAARTYTITQTSPAAGTQLTMGSTVPITFRITNTSTSPNTGERIYELRFRLPGTGTIFSSTTAAPAGWTRTAYSTTSVTFQSANWATAITTGAFLDFTLVLVMRSTTADISETLRDARARYTTTTSGPPFTRLASLTVNNPGSWVLKSLNAVFQIVDAVSGSAITAVQSGKSFKLIMTVTNRSTATQSSIISNPNPPTPTKTGTVTQVLTSTIYSPNPLTLAPGASGTITFTYSTSAGPPADSGTISFTANARNNTNAATSPTITSIILSVNPFSASIDVNPACVYVSQNFAVTMTLTNGFTNNITISAFPTLTLSGVPVVLVSAPSTPLPATVLANGGTLPLTWTYQISGGTLGQPATFTGSATGTEQGTGIARTTLPSSSFATLGGYTFTVTPGATNVSSQNEELIWSFTNQGCAALSSVSISIPAGWSWGGDAYSLVEKSPGVFVETWTFSQATSSSPVVFSAPSAADQIVIGGSGQFNMVFTATPTVTGVSGPFNIVTTDANGRPDNDSTTVTVNTFNFNSLNSADTEAYREDFR